MTRVVCQHCGRYLMDAVGTVVATNVICSNSKCKRRLNIKIVDSDSASRDVFYKFDQKTLLQHPSDNHNEK